MHSNSGAADTAPAGNGRLRYVKAEQRTKWPDPFASRTGVQFGSGLSAQLGWAVRDCQPKRHATGGVGGDGGPQG